MIKKRKKPVLSPVGEFQNPFGDEVVQMEDAAETNAMTSENGDQIWLRRVSCAQPIFGRN